MDPSTNSLKVGNMLNKNNAKECISFLKEVLNHPDFKIIIEHKSGIKIESTHKFWINFETESELKYTIWILDSKPWCWSKMHILKPKDLSNIDTRKRSVIKQLMNSGFIAVYNKTEQEHSIELTKDKMPIMVSIKVDDYDKFGKIPLDRLGV